MNSKDLAEDPHLNERGFSTRLPHPQVGEGAELLPAVYAGAQYVDGAQRTHGAQQRMAA